MSDHRWDGSTGPEGGQWSPPGSVPASSEEQWLAPLHDTPSSGGRGRGLAAGVGVLSLALVGGAVWCSSTLTTPDVAAGGSATTVAPQPSATATPSSTAAPSSSTPSEKASPPSKASTSSGSAGSPAAGRVLNRPNFSFSVPLPAGWTPANHDQIYGFETLKKGSFVPDKVVSVREGRSWVRTRVARVPPPQTWPTSVSQPRIW